MHYKMAFGIKNADTYPLFLTTHLKYHYEQDVVLCSYSTWTISPSISHTNIVCITNLSCSSRMLRLKCFHFIWHNYDWMTTTIFHIRSCSKLRKDRMWVQFVSINFPKKSFSHWLSIGQSAIRIYFTTQKRTHTHSFCFNLS